MKKTRKETVRAFPRGIGVTLSLLLILTFGTAHTWRAWMRTRSVAVCVFAGSIWLIFLLGFVLFAWLRRRGFIVPPPPPSRWAPRFALISGIVGAVLMLGLFVVSALTGSALPDLLLTLAGLLMWCSAVWMMYREDRRRDSASS